MQTVAIEGVIFFAIMLGGLGLALVNGVLWIILHNILYKKLDMILFHEPWFSRAELAMYSGWPLSLMKSMLYMFLISFPVFSRKRRFKGFDQTLAIGPYLRAMCKICVSLLFLTALFGVAFFIYGGSLYVINHW